MRYPIKTARARKNIKSNDALARELIDAYPDEFGQFKQGNERSLGTKLGELDRGKTSWWRNRERTNALARLISHLDLERDDLALDRGAGQHQLTLSSFPQFPPLHLQREAIWKIGKPQLGVDTAMSLPSRYRSELRYSDFFGHSCLVKFTDRSPYENIEEDVHPGTQGRSRETGTGAGPVH